MTLDPLDCPPDLHYLVEHQVWARFGGDGTATVGITALGIAQAGEIYMARPKAPGTVVAAGRSVAVVELAKAIVSVKSPVDGTIAEVNPRLATEPELVHRDPYGAGWLARVVVPDERVAREALLHGPDVLPAMRHHAWLSRLDPP